MGLFAALRFALGSGFRVQGLGFRVQGFRGLGFRVQGLGFRFCNLAVLFHVSPCCNREQLGIVLIRIFGVLGIRVFFWPGWCFGGFARLLWFLGVQGFFVALSL